MNVRNLRISTRLGLGFGAMALLIVAIGAAALLQLRTVDQSFDLVLKDRYIKIERLHDLKSEVAAIASRLQTTALLDDPGEIRQQVSGVMAGRGRTGEIVGKLESELTDPRAIAALGAVKAERERYVGVQDLVLKKFSSGQDIQAREALHKDLGPVQSAYFETIDKLIAVQGTLMHEAAQQATGTVAVLRAVLLGAMACALVCAALLAFWIVRSIGGPLRHAVGVARAVAAGDLGVAIEDAGRNEMGELLAALREMQQSLARVVGHVRHNADSVATAASQIAQGNNDLSGRTEEQASALQQTAASMKQLSTTVRQNAEHAQQGNGVAGDAAAVAARGGEVVGRVVETMREINQSSRRISDIIGVIDGIAFQTNILALNAAVEAARAGEQGRGFAVVAGEVRTLAQRSAEAAREIKELITASVGRVDQGSALVDQAGATMTEVVQAIRRVADLMGDISSASTEQSTGVRQIEEAVRQMDQATQQNAALVEESAAAAASLKGQAQQLVQAVAVFKFGGDAGGEALALPLAAPPAAPAANAPTLEQPAAPAPRKRQPAPQPQLQPQRTGTDDDWQSF